MRYFFYIFLSLFAYSLSGQNCQVNIFVAYSEEAQQEAGSSQQMVDQIKTAVDGLNTSFTYSVVSHEYELVRTLLIPNSESGCFASDLNKFQVNPLAALQRVKYHADVAILVLSNNEFCGLSYYDNVLAVDSTAFCAVNYQCMVENFSLAHQVGHLYGCGHEPATNRGPTESLYPYGHSYHWSYNEDCAQFSTIMAVDDATNCSSADAIESCFLIPYWSNPKVSYFDIPLGKEGINDNASVLNKNAAAIGALKKVPLQQNIRDSIVQSDVAVAVANDSLTNEGTYKLKDQSNVQFRAGLKITLDAGFSAQEGSHFETFIQKNTYCGEQ